MRLRTNIAIGALIATSALSYGAYCQTPAPGFVQLPKEIGCTVQGMSFMSTVGADGQLHSTAGSVKGVTCWLSATPNKKKEIPLAKTTISDGMLPTKDFGNLQISPVNNINSAGVYMAISADKLPALKEFLEK